jgi:hypothetical protein
VKGEVRVWISEGSTDIQQRLDLLKPFVKYTVKSVKSVGVDIQDDANVPVQTIVDRILAAAEADPAAAAPAAGAGGGFRYALVNRPADLGTVPKVQYTVEPRPAPGQPHHAMARHGILATERELTEAELKAYELAPLVDGEDLQALAQKVAEGMREYAQGYAEQAADDPADFREAVLRTAASSEGGVKFSVGDPEALVASVATLVRAMAEQAAQQVPAQPSPTPAVAELSAAPTAADAIAQGERAADIALLKQIADGRHPQMLDPELADQIEAALARHPGDAEIAAAVDAAVNAYSNGLMAATGS